MYQLQQTAILYAAGDEMTSTPMCRRRIREMEPLQSILQ